MIPKLPAHVQKIQVLRDKIDEVVEAVNGMLAIDRQSILAQKTEYDLMFRKIDENITKLIDTVNHLGENDTTTRKCLADVIAILRKGADDHHS